MTEEGGTTQGSLFFAWLFELCLLTLFCFLRELAARQFNELCIVTSTIVGLFSCNNKTLDKITAVVVDRVDKLLRDKCFTKEKLKPVVDELSRLVLYKNLFPSDLEEFKDKSTDELAIIFAAKFPEEIVEVNDALGSSTLLSFVVTSICVVGIVAGSNSSKNNNNNYYYRNNSNQHNNNNNYKRKSTTKINTATTTTKQHQHLQLKTTTTTTTTTH